MMDKLRIGFFATISILATTIIAVSASGLQDEDHHPAKTHTHDAHVHGTWELFAALDSKQLSLTVSGPIVDVIGFEHRPTDDKERATIKVLKARLEQPDNLIALNTRAKCVLAQPAQILLPAGFLTVHTTDKKNKSHRDENHQGDEGGKHHGNHEDDYEAHEDNDHASNLEVNYVFNCKTPKRLRSITLTGFETFPSIENVDAVFLSDAKQIARRLVPGSNSKILKIN